MRFLNLFRKAKDPEILVKEFLEKIQRSSPFRTPVSKFSVEKAYPIADTDAPEKKALQAFLRSHMEKIVKAIPSRYENPMFYDIVYRSTQILDKILKNNFKQKFAKPVFGSLGTGQISGQVVVVPDTDSKLILLDDGAFIFFYMVAAVVAELFPYLSKGGSHTFDFEKKPDESLILSIIKRLDQIIHAYVYTAHPLTYWPTFAASTDQKNKLTAEIINAIDIFMIGHEYGHIVGDHLKTDNIVDKRVAKNKGRTYSILQKQELEADSFGCYFTIESIPFTHADSKISTMAIYLLFNIWELTYKCVNMSKNGRWEVSLPESYPNFTARIGNAIFHLSIRHDKTDLFWIDFLIAYLNDQLMFKLEGFLQTMFTERYKAREQRSTRWNFN